MNNSLIFIGILSMVLISACTAPPEDLTRVSANTKDDNTGDQMTEGMMQEEEMPGDVTDDGPMTDTPTKDMDPGIGDAMENTGVESMKDESNLEKVPLSKENSMFEFEGYAVGKSHVGTFDIWDGYFTYEDSELVGLIGEIDASSVDTGISGLDNHLKNDDFFDVENHPLITFESSEIRDDEIVGTLDFLGVKNEMVIPAEISEDMVTSEFVFNTRDHGMKYPGVNDEVRIAFTFSR